ncbi:MAG: MFS transporter [Clostridiaceae bacterium]|nr:MFS transporter [Clostridiaceae bacterium]
MIESKRYINAFCYFALCLLGVYLSVYQSVVADIALDYHLDAGQTGMMISFHFLGSFLLPLILGEAGDRFGTKPILRLAFMTLIAGLVFIIAGRVPVLFLIGTLLVGGGFSVIEGMLSGLLTLANPDRVNSVMNLSQMYFCLGAVGGPFVVFGLKLAGWGWRINYSLILILFLVCLIVAGRLSLPAYRTAPIKGLQLKRLLRDRTFIILLIAIFLYVGVEEGTAFWVTSYIKEALTTQVPGLIFLSVYWLGMACGRWLFSMLKQSFKRWLIIGLAAACLFMCSFLLLQQSGWVLICLFLVGFGFAPVWPVLMMTASDRGTDATNSAMGAMMSLGAVGGMAVPFALGQLANSTGMTRAMLLMPLLLFVLMGLVLSTGRKRKD